MIKKKYYRLSPPQKCYTKIGMIQSNNSGCNIIYTFSLEENYSQDVILNRITDIINQHDSLRLYFKYRGKELYQYYLEKCENAPVEFITTFDMPVKEEEFISSQSCLFIKKIFDLNKWPLFRVKVHMLKDKILFFIAAHHLIIDGFGLNLLGQNIKKNLRSMTNQKNTEMAFLQYKDFSVKSNILRKRSILFKDAQRYWENKFNNNFASTHITPSNYNLMNGSSLGWSYKKSLNLNLAKKIKAFCLSEEITIFNFFLACFCILISHILNKNNINILVPTLGRATSEEMNTIGMFAVPVVIKPCLEFNSTFKNVLQLLKEDLLNAQMFSIYKLDDLMEFLNIKPCNDKFPITSIVFNQETKQNTINSQDNSVNHQDTGRDIRFDLQGLIYADNTNMALELIYRRDVFLPLYIEKIWDTHQKIIHDVLDNPDIKIGQLNS